MKSHTVPRHIPSAHLDDSNHTNASDNCTQVLNLNGLNNNNKWVHVINSYTSEKIDV